MDYLKELEKRACRVADGYKLSNLLIEHAAYEDAVQAIIRGVERDCRGRVKSMKDLSRHQAKQKVLADFQDPKGSFSAARATDWHPPTEAELEASVSGDEPESRRRSLQTRPGHLSDAFGEVRAGSEEHFAVDEERSSALYEAVLKRDCNRIEDLIAEGHKPDEEMIYLSVRGLGTPRTEMFVKANPKAASDAMRAAVRNKYRYDTVILVMCGAMPDNETLDYAKSELDSNWTKLLRMAGSDGLEFLRNESDQLGLRDSHGREVSLPVEASKKLSHLTARNPFRPKPRS